VAARQLNFARAGHAAKTPSSRFATPPLRSGAFGVTASRRRGLLPASPFGARCGPKAAIAHQKDLQANGRRRVAGRLVAWTIQTQLAL